MKTISCLLSLAIMTFAASALHAEDEITRTALSGLTVPSASTIIGTAGGDTAYYSATGITYKMSNNGTTLRFEDNVNLTGTSIIINGSGTTNNSSRHVSIAAEYVDLESLTVNNNSSNTINVNLFLGISNGTSYNYAVDQSYDTLTLKALTNLYTSTNANASFDIGTLNITNMSVLMFTAKEYSSDDSTTVATGLVNNLKLFEGSTNITLDSSSSINLVTNLVTSSDTATNDELAAAQTWTVSNQTISGAGTITTSSDDIFGGSNFVLADGATIAPSDGDFTISGNISVSGDATISITVSDSLTADKLIVSSGNFIFSGDACLTLLLDMSAVDLESLDETFSLALSDFITMDDYSSLTDTTFEVELTNTAGLDLEYSFESGSITFTQTGGAVPEPSTYAMIFGVIALGFAYYRRKK